MTLSRGFRTTQAQKMSKNPTSEKEVAIRKTQKNESNYRNAQNY